MSSHFQFSSLLLGKTLAFGLPVLDFLLRNWKEYSNRVSPVALIIAPTRELAMQISTGTYAPANCTGTVNTAESSVRGWDKIIFRFFTSGG